MDNNKLKVTVALVGSRDFTDYELFKTKVKYYTQNLGNFSIVSGGAKGADTLAKQYAAEFGHEFIEHLADWDKHGKSAGFKRNATIVENCTHLIAFQINDSKGTQHSIDLAKSANKPVRVVKISKNGGLV